MVFVLFGFFLLLVVVWACVVCFDLCLLFCDCCGIGLVVFVLCLVILVFVVLILCLGVVGLGAFGLIVVYVLVWIVLRSFQVCLFFRSFFFFGFVTFVGFCIVFLVWGVILLSVVGFAVEVWSLMDLVFVLVSVYLVFILGT